MTPRLAPIAFRRWFMTVVDPGIKRTTALKQQVFSVYTRGVSPPGVKASGLEVSVSDLLCRALDNDFDCIVRYTRGGYFLTWIEGYGHLAVVPTAGKLVKYPRAFQRLGAVFVREATPYERELVGPWGTRVTLP